MKNGTRTIDTTSRDDLNLSELGEEDLQRIAGGTILGNTWDGIKDRAELIGKTAEAHPAEAAAAAVGVLSGGIETVGMAAVAVVAEPVMHGVESAAGLAVHGVKDVADDIETLF